MGKILLFYKYVQITYPKQIIKWQKKICQDLGLTGRILIAHEGINATVGGSVESTDRYKAIMEQHPQFGGIDYKESEGGADSFNRLYVTERNEIVGMGVDPNELTVAQGGKHLTPQEVHELISKQSKDLVILDTRNDYEWQIGRFEGAINPKLSNFRQFPKYIDEHLDEFKDKEVLMYCTGGVRCERATAYLKIKDVAKEVYQIQGGIVRYTEQFPNGYFRGKNYVFDNRIAVRINDDVLSACSLCSEPCDEYTNCLNATCNNHFIACPACISKYGNTCSATCQDLIERKVVKARPPFKKTPEKTSCCLI